nr:polymorphic toxin-type HINT domain-containing protein [Paenibacillus whitsoniae]
MTKDGERSIEQVKLGDFVLAKNPDTGEMAYKEVDLLFQKEITESWNITVGNELITTTDEHPFWIHSKGWVVAKDLVVGDLFETSDGSYLAVDKIEVKAQHTTVYNFRVKDFHTYYVSNLKILTHNSSCPDYKNNVTGKRSATINSGTNSARLANALESVGFTRPDPDYSRGIQNWEAHHIIPAGESFPSAISAREILKEFHIDVNSPTNGVWLPKNPGEAFTSVEWSDSIASHNGRHIEAYYIYVDQKLQTAVNRGGTDEQITVRIEQTIEEIRQELLTGKIKLHSYN